VARAELPPLRAREGDIGVLARQFWKQLGGDPAAIPYEAFARFEDCRWPGNVRELFNAVMRLVALGEWAETASRAQESRDGGAESREQLDSIDEILALKLPLPRARERVVQELERRYVERVLLQHGGSVAKAAAASGIALRYLSLRESAKRAPQRFEDLVVKSIDGRRSGRVSEAPIEGSPTDGVACGPEAGVAGLER
jgi:two-component system, NtrC family, response regulator HydG